jgi:hypothetical protein
MRLAHQPQYLAEITREVVIGGTRTSGCSKHEVARDVPIGVSESRVWSSEPGAAALRADLT